MDLVSAVQTQLRSNAQRVFSTKLSFAALKANAPILSWGHPEYGAGSSAVQTQLRIDVQQVLNSHTAFAALKADGSVVSCGDLELSKN